MTVHLVYSKQGCLTLSLNDIGIAVLAHTNIEYRPIRIFGRYRRIWRAMA